MQFQQVNAIPSSKAAVAKVAREQAAIDAGLTFKPVTTQVKGKGGGAAMFCLTVAALTILGAMTTGRKAFPWKALTGLFGSDTAYKYHRGKGNFEDTSGADTGRLTVAGWNHFGGRVKGIIAGQAFRQADLDAMQTAIKTGKATPGTLTTLFDWRETGAVK